jgi:thiamine-phosphate pyrophosphorylase
MPVLTMTRTPLDLSLYLVTDTALCGDRGVPATVAAAVAAGVTAVQLRDPAAGDDELLDLGRAVARELEGTGVPLIVNDRVHLVEAIGAQGAHVGQNDLDVASARAKLGPAAYLGLSVQTPAHVETAREMGVVDLIDYLGVGPVFAQSTKVDAASPGGLGVWQEIVARSPWPCVAIGGIDARRAARVRARGGAGIAVVSAICGRADVASATRELRQAWSAEGRGS